MAQPLLKYDEHEDRALRPEEVDGSYDVRVQGKRPCMVVEVVSESTKDVKDKDEKHNVELFEKAGVKDHVLVYPKRPGKRDRIELCCRTLGPMGKYVGIPPDAQGRFLLKSVNLWISVSEDGERLVFEDATTGERLLSSREEEAERRAAQRRADAAQRRAEKEETARQEAEGRAEEAETRAEEERFTRQEAETRAEAAKSQAERAKESVAELEALLAKLGHQPAAPNDP